jgi:tRNA-modifying protein YgfZ
MHEGWATFLTQHGFEIRDRLGAQRAFLAAARPLPGSHLVDLNHLTALRLAGADARSFLQGYLTCDLDQLDESHAVCGAYCNIKGRVIADALVVLWDGQPTLVLPAALRDVVTAGLAKYLAFARSVFDPPERAPLLLGLIDPPPPRVAALTVSPWRSGQAVALPGNVPRALLLLDGDDARAEWHAFAARDRVADADGWDLIDIDSHIAHVQAVTSERFLPQMLDYDALGWVSFTKGCYLGQEIVARTQHLGRAKRRLIRLRWQGELPAIGTELRGSDRTGTIVAVAPTGARNGEALAVLGDGSAASFTAAGTTFDAVAPAADQVSE